MANWESLIGAKIEAHRDTHKVCKVVKLFVRSGLVGTSDRAAADRAAARRTIVQELDENAKAILKRLNKNT